MTKNTKDEQNDEKKLTWKLKTLPTVDEIRDLVDSGIIKADEARQLLFKEETPQSDADKVAALEEMVKTLQDMVQQLLNKPNNIINVPYTRVIEVEPKYRPYWEKTWMGNGGAVWSMTTTESLPNGSIALNVNTSKWAGQSAIG